jgi:hypothetical protein
MTARRPLALLAAALLLVLPAGCRTNYDRPGPGVITGRYRIVVKVIYWHLRITTDTGEHRNYLSSYREYLTCHVGDRWPDCGEKTS